jgi:hypothetical protein
MARILTSELSKKNGILGTVDDKEPLRGYKRETRGLVHATREWSEDNA